MLKACLLRRAFCVLGGVRRRLSGGCHGNARGRRKSGEIRRPRGISWQNPSPSAGPVATIALGCHESRRGRLGTGERRLPRALLWQGISPSEWVAATLLPACHGSTRGRNGQTESFALGRSRGERRLPWAAAWQLSHRGATGACEGDGKRAKSVALGSFRGKIRLPWRLSRRVHAGCPYPHSAFRYHVAHED